MTKNCIFTGYYVCYTLLHKIWKYRQTGSRRLSSVKNAYNVQCIMTKQNGKYQIILMHVSWEKRDKIVCYTVLHKIWKYRQTGSRKFSSLKNAYNIQFFVTLFSAYMHQNDLIFGILLCHDALYVISIFQTWKLSTSCLPILSNFM